MTELEKCNAGLFYEDSPERMQLHLKSADACFDFNNTRPSQLQQREQILRDLLKHVGEDFYVEPTFYCSFGFNLSVGDHFFANRECLFMDDAPITFGDYVFIGPDCHFYTAHHPIHSALRNQKLEQGRPIQVGDNVWFGGHCTVLPGITIGSNVVIGAGSVVTRDIPDNVVAAGNPCRILRQITDEDLQEVARVNGQEIL